MERKITFIAEDKKQERYGPTKGKQELESPAGPPPPEKGKDLETNPIING